jgi:putative addiction module component (TIGR02574 family)
MNTDVENTITAALELPAQVRAFLAEKLIESLDSCSVPELSEEWKQEISKRCREIDEGAVVLRNAQDVFDQAYTRLE